MIKKPNGTYEIFALQSASGFLLSMKFKINFRASGKIN